MPQKHYPQDITGLIDYEIVRAQMANCVLEATELLCDHNEELALRVQFIRMADMLVLLLLQHNVDEEGERFYEFTLMSPEGDHARLARINLAGEQVPHDALDNSLAAALGKSLPSTVGMAFEHAVGTVVPPTCNPEAPQLH